MDLKGFPFGVWYFFSVSFKAVFPCFLVPPGPVMPWTYTMLYGIIFGTAVKTCGKNTAGCKWELNGEINGKISGKSAGDSTSGGFVE